ncbi:hypothetical protein D3C81_2194850 [compost metagenome]
MQSGRQRCQRETELLHQLALRRLWRPQVGAVRGGGVHQRADRLWRQGNALLNRLQLLIKLGNACRRLLFMPGDLT